MRMTALEDELRGKVFEKVVFEEAAARLGRWIVPLSDLRGSKEYRMLVCQNLLLKFYDGVVGSGGEVIVGGGEVASAG
jgi:xanthine dehydrogenase small subunit